MNDLKDKRFLFYKNESEHLEIHLIFEGGSA
jgi:hypothetical protein